MDGKDFIEILCKIRKEMHEISNSLMSLSGRAELAKNDDIDRLKRLREVAEKEVEKISEYVNNVYTITEEVIKELENNGKTEDTDM